MTASFNCGPALFEDGTTWTALIGRQYDSGTAVLDSGLSASAVTPAGGVYPALSATLQVTAPASGLSVSVSAGYRFGLMTSGSLTVASNATGSTRQDYVIANVQDLGNSGSFAQVEYVTGTTSAPALPVNSIVLAQVSVPNAASSIVAGNITDLRGFVCAPGGILFIPAETDAPAAPVSQIMWEADTGGLVQGSGIAGSVLPVSLAGAGAGTVPVPVVTTFTTSGSHTYTAPAGVVTAFVECWGGGGSGGNEGEGLDGGGAGGGSGGEYAAEPAYPIQAGQSYTVAVGAGGTGSSSFGGSPGNPGGNSTFATTGVVAHGGKGGRTASESGPGAAAQGGTGSTNSVAYPGGAGGRGGTQTSNPGGGGGGGGSGGNGSAGQPGGSGTPTAAGPGGTAVNGGGPGGTGGATTGSGAGHAPVSGPGGGSGGTAGSLPGVATEPAGAAGQVRITTTTSAAAAALDYVTGVSTTTDAVTVAQVAIAADGKTNFEFLYQRDPTAGGVSRQGWLRLYIDSALLDTTYCQDTATIRGRISATCYTSSAGGTTPSKGIHTVKLTSSVFAGTVTLRAAPVIT
jgi:hyaluronate lyase